MTEKLRTLLSSPPMVVFELSLLGALIWWGVRQEYINRYQQFQIDQRIDPLVLERRLGTIERRLDALERK